MDIFIAIKKGKANMETNVTNEQKAAARKVNLYNFLLRNHPNEVLQEGDSIRLCCNHSISIKEEYCGYTDFATDETGNSVDCLTKYFDYTFLEAVNALLADAGGAGAGTAAPVQDARADAGTQASGKGQRNPFVLPETDGSFKELFHYLSTIRGISSSVLADLLWDGVMYQERTHNNVVFVNPEKNFAEIRGTNPKKSFHQVMYDGDPAAFWWFKKDGLDSDPEVAYICESAIDALSMYCIHRIYNNYEKNGLYCSIAGVANQKRIDRIKVGMGAAGLPVILAVDNDDAGEQCRRRNPDCNYIIPNLKDWNEMLLDIINKETDEESDLRRRLY